MPLSLLLSCLALSISLAGGQILFKFTAIDMKARVGGSWWEVAFSPWLLASLVLYAFSTALWIWILTHVPLSKAYPFVLISACLVPVASHFLFGENLTLRYVIGFAIVLAGLAVIQSV